MAMENGIEGDLSTCDIDHEEGSQQSNINISDVIEVIQTTDPSFEAAVQNCGGEMFSGGGAIPGSGSLQHAPLQQPSPHQHQRRRNAYVQIVEEPASKALRFRYECEGRSAGSIPGVHSTPENKTYPTIEIVGYKGRAVVVVSCVTKDKPYRPHPHNLVGKDGCKKGVCTVEINSDSMCVSFSNLGIQCVKKKDIEDALRVREEIRVDPYKTGYGHRNQPTSIDLNAVRLCFQVFLEGPEKGRFTLPLTPIVSDTIYDKKAMSELVICKMSHCSAPVAGGREVILLCEKVAKEDITIKFYEEIDGKTVWEGYGDFQHANVHKQVAIAFRTPRYRTLDVEQPVKVNIQLRRPTDGATSDPLPFELLPLDSDPVVLKRKRQKYSGEPDVHLRNLQPPAQDIASMDPLAQLQPHGHVPIYQQFFEMSPEQSIKMEPRDQTPSPYGGVALPQFGGMYRTMQDSPSPQHHATPSPPLDYAGGSCWPLPAMVPPIAPSAGMPGPPPDHTTLSSLLDMDSHQLTQLSTNDVSLSTLLEGTLSNSYQMPQRADSLNRMNVEQENMTDSLSRLTTNALNQHFTGAEDLPVQPYGRQ